ncbi:MAG: hypothetical protein HY094_01650 [Candidatus Melainabacteria bacterium]|nr:hypothetical protein [Candidatus Melainabacteria bacterium]
MKTDTLILTDDILLQEARKISNQADRINHIKKTLEKSPGLYLNSAIYLIKETKKSDPIYAYDLAFKLSHKSIGNSFPYFLMAEIAVENKAWQVAKSALEVAKWFSFGHKNKVEKANNLLQLVLKKIINNEKDNSVSEIWSGKLIDKSYVLLLIFDALSEESFFQYSIQLIKSFPGELENYDRVYQTLYLVEDKDTVKKFADFIKNDNCISIEHKNLCLGIAYYNLHENDISINLLEEVLKINSENLNARFYMTLNYLIKGNETKFTQSFEKLLPSPNLSQEVFSELIKTASPLFLAAFFIWCSVLNIETQVVNITQEKNISVEMAKLIIEVYKQAGEAEVDNLLSKFKTLNYFSLLPMLSLYLSELFIKENQFKKAKELLTLSQDIEVHRLLAWIYRLEGKESESEKELVEYRKNLGLSTDRNIAYKMVRLSLPEEVPGDTEKIMKLLEDAYLQTAAIKEKIALEYGILKNTCFEAKCNECCKKTFPIISYTEYFYLNNWLEKQSEDLRKQVRANSLNIVNAYKQKYKKDPPFLTATEASINRVKHYPADFVFDCPALVPEGCSVYEAQPFICRAYGYASPDRISFMGCNFYIEQFKVATTLTPMRKVIDMLTFGAFVKLTDEKLLGIDVVAPIPVWFAQDHKRTAWLARGRRLSKGLFAPVFSFMTRLYFDMLDKKALSKQ